MRRILSFLPRQRQTLLFSATLPQQVMKVAGLALKQDHAFIDTVGEEDADTNIQVRGEDDELDTAGFRMLKSNLRLVFDLLRVCHR